MTGKTGRMGSEVGGVAQGGVGDGCRSAVCSTDVIRSSNSLHILLNCILADVDIVSCDGLIKRLYDGSGSGFNIFFTFQSSLWLMTIAD